MAAGEYTVTTKISGNKYYNNYGPAMKKKSETKYDKNDPNKKTVYRTTTYNRYPVKKKSSSQGTGKDKKKTSTLKRHPFPSGELHKASRISAERNGKFNKVGGSGGNSNGVLSESSHLVADMVKKCKYAMQSSSNGGKLATVAIVAVVATVAISATRRAAEKRRAKKAASAESEENEQ